MEGFIQLMKMGLLLNIRIIPPSLRHKAFSESKKGSNYLIQHEKILKGERTQHCFYNRIGKLTVSGSCLINIEIKPTFRTLCGVLIHGVVLFVLRLFLNIEKMKLKRLWTGGLLKVVLFYYSLLQSLIIPIPI